MKKPPVHLLHNFDHLLPKELESKLANELITKYYKDGIWSQESKERGVFIDLSLVRSIDLGAVNQLVLFVEYALKSNVNILIALPYLKLFEKNINRKKEDTPNQLDERKQTSAFLKEIDFHNAVLCKHLQIENIVSITDQFEPLNFNLKTNITFSDYNILSKKGLSNSFFNNTGQYLTKPRNEYSIFPLTWLNSNEDFFISKDQISIFENVIYKNNKSDKLIEPLDFQDIEHTILLELLKNVKEHAGANTQYALFSMGVFEPKNIWKIITKKNIYEYETDYYELIIQRDSKNIIEIFFGDSGKGILNTRLKEAYKASPKNKYKQDICNFDCLEWSFDKWSTSKTLKNGETRGTKGLYRIKRLVDRYDGAIIVRNKKVHGGYVKKEKEISKWVDNSKNQEKYVYRNGTFIQFLLCPLKYSLKYHFNFKKHGDYAQDWNLFNHIFNIPKEKRADGDKSESLIDDFKAKLKIEIERGRDLIVILDVELSSLNNFEQSVEVQLKYIFEECLFHLAFARHPNRIMVYFAYNQGNETIKSYADSASDRITEVRNTKDTRNHEQKFDPVVIVGKNNSVFWYGGNTTLTKVLDELSSLSNTNNKIELTESKTFSVLNNSEKQSIKSALKAENSYISIDKGTITFNFFNLPDSSEDYLKKSFNIETTNKITVSPKLKLIDKWVNINEIINGLEFFYALQLSFLIKRKEPNREIKSNTKILIDNQVQYKITTEIAKLIGIQFAEESIKNLQNDVDYHIPRRTRLFNKGEDVIIFTTIISSSETIRRMVKQIRRDEANVLFIMCLANLRKKNITKMETWGGTSNIYSLYQKYSDESKEDEDLKKKLEKLNSVFKDLTKDITLIERDFKENIFININGNINKSDKKTYLKKHEHQIDESIKDYLQTTKSLHYGHYGEFNHRHFTFFLNKEKILRSNQAQEKIWGKFVERIASWITKASIKQNKDISLVLPQKDKSSNQSLLIVADYLRKHFTNINNEIISFENLTKRSPKSNLIYLDFGSLTGGSINKLISGISNVDNILICILFSQLQEKDTKFYQRISRIKTENNKIINVDIEYIYKLPLRHYNSANCPICEHLRVLEKYKGENQYLIDFANDRKERIQIKDKTSIGQLPVDYYAINGNQGNYELSSETITEMFILNLLISKAKISTLYRTKLYNYIFEIYISRDSMIEKLNSKMYALLYLLSNEVYLLQREPLVFKDIRKMLVEISLKVATAKFTTLVIYFNNKKHWEGHETSPENLATRYKFAATIVLRSANKYIFCKNIYQIVESSIKSNDKPSDNLVQNTFFHINTIHENNYNSSIDYFDLLKKSLGKLFENFSDKFTFKNRVLLQLTMLKNIRLKKDSEIKQIKTDMDVIIALKKEVNLKYGEDNNHPDALESFRAMSLIDDKEKEILEGYEMFFDRVNKIQSKIVSHWFISSSFLEEIYNAYICKLSDNILDSKLFIDSYFTQQIVKYKIIEKFTHSVFTIENEDTQALSKHIKSHNALYNKILDFLLKRDSKLHKIINQYPTNIIEPINESWSNEGGFKSVNINNDINDETVEVFYPTTSVDKLLTSIKDNIIQRIDDSLHKSDITIDIRIYNDEEFIVIVIKNNHTLTKKDNHNGGEGALIRFQKDIVSHGGYLKYGGNKEDEFYVVTIKLLRYGRIKNV